MLDTLLLNLLLEVFATLFFFFNDTATTEIYTLSLHDALPICPPEPSARSVMPRSSSCARAQERSEEHTSELQSLQHLVCRLLLEKKQDTCELQFLSPLVCCLLLTHGAQLSG